MYKKLGFPVNSDKSYSLQYGSSMVTTQLYKTFCCMEITTLYKEKLMGQLQEKYSNAGLTRQPKRKKNSIKGAHREKNDNVFSEECVCVCVFGWVGVYTNFQMMEFLNGPSLS